MYAQYIMYQNNFDYLLVPHCKERWRNLRACLTRHLKQQNTIADSSPAHKPYYLADHMEFLLPYTRSRAGKDQIKFETTFDDFNASSINETDNNAETTTTYTITTSEPDENQYVTLIQTTTDAMQSTNTIKTSPSKADRPNSDVTDQQAASTIIATPKEHLQEIIYETMPAKRVRVATGDSDDADLEFLRSLLPDIRLMNASQKRRFKMRIFGLIEDVLSNNEQS